jgi:hypothetical protein
VEKAGEGVVVEKPLALLLVRFLYCVIFSWKEVLIGGNFPVHILPRSSADLDHARWAIFRRSPKPELGEGGDEVEFGKWYMGVSREVGGVVEDRSRTDLSYIYTASAMVTKNGIEKDGIISRHAICVIVPR